MNFVLGDPICIVPWKHSRCRGRPSIRKAMTDLPTSLSLYSVTKVTLLSKVWEAGRRMVRTVLLDVREPAAALNTETFTISTLPH